MSSDPCSPMGAAGSNAQGRFRRRSAVHRWACPSRHDPARRYGYILAISGSLAGCTSGAPSLTLFGAYFPAWLACAIIGIAAAAVMRLVMVATGLSETVPYQFWVCVALGSIVALGFASLWYGL
jgi:hypothetical protein